MSVRGYYIWVRRDNGHFDTIFLPTTNFAEVKKYFLIHVEMQYIACHCDEKIFSTNEKEGLFNLMLELNNL